MLTTCAQCGTPLLSAPCPSCAGTRASAGPSGAALLLGLTLAGCGKLDLDKDSVGVQPPYGISEMDEDADGYPAYEDCDDQDPEIHPDAKETPKDGVDANCNGDDNT